ncbi:hypothetical protein [Rufibacter aurantiacus]|uniref:hypothetical protein n=1 Tax=Rufibacter aurantiacus TaxID=2817374 RepID=UPI001B3027F3|nr:hypothetical protein [Rufibacter aurantiacus]
MKNIQLLFEHLSFLLDSSEEIIGHPPYYYSRIQGAGMERVVSKSIPLGALLEFWNEVPVNTAGMILLTSDTLGSDPSLAKEAKRLEEESGFACRYPVSGIPRHELVGILNRFMRQFEGKDLPIAVPLELVLEELQARKPMEQRYSYRYLTMESKLNDSIIFRTGTSAFCSKLLHPAGGRKNRRQIQSTVFFFLQQDEEMNLQLVIGLRVPTVYPHGRGLSFITSGRAARVAENLQNCYSEMEMHLLESGFEKQKASVTLESIGINGVFRKNSTGILPEGKEVETLASLLVKLRQVLERCGFWEEGNTWFEVDRETEIHDY